MRLLDQAVEWQRMLDGGEVATRAQLAARVGVTGARVSQVLALLRLDPRILDWIRSLPAGTPKRLVTERQLRAIARMPVADQLRALPQRGLIINDKLYSVLAV